MNINWRKWLCRLDIQHRWDRHRDILGPQRGATKTCLRCGRSVKWVYGWVNGRQELGMYWCSEKDAPLVGGWIAGNILFAMILGTICHFTKFMPETSWWQHVGMFILAPVILVVFFLVFTGLALGVSCVFSQGWKRFNEWLNNA